MNQHACSGYLESEFFCRHGHLQNHGCLERSKIIPVCLYDDGPKHPAMTVLDKQGHIRPPNNPQEWTVVRQEAP